MSFHGQAKQLRLFNNAEPIIRTVRNAVIGAYSDKEIINIVNIGVLLDISYKLDTVIEHLDKNKSQR